MVAPDWAWKSLAENFKFMTKLQTFRWDIAHASHAAVGHIVDNLAHLVGLKQLKLNSQISRYIITPEHLLNLLNILDGLRYLEEADIQTFQADDITDTELDIICKKINKIQTTVKRFNIRPSNGWKNFCDG